jgi:glycosidase
MKAGTEPHRHSGLPALHASFLHRIIFALVTVLACANSWGQPIVTRIDPPNWWGGMHLDTVRLLLYGRQLDGIRVVSTSGGIRVLRVIPAASPGHAFVDIRVLPQAAGSSHRLLVLRGRDTAVVAYPVLRRVAAGGRYGGFSPADVLYLIMPDRFADGDTANGTVPGMTDTLQRTQPFGRHGGDIQGIIDHLEYLAGLGVTALWINPLVENNMPAYSYHGYSATDLYRVDPRFGTNALYGRLVLEAHKRNLKIIMDHVSNHIGSSHPWMRDLPTLTWINGSMSSHQMTHHVKVSLIDPHADSSTQENLVQGWFSGDMPDLNQKDASLAAYIIENTIWWIESSGIDGIREDTYPYADPRFMEQWCGAILREYPRFSIVGEVWTGEPVFLAPFQRGSRPAPGVHGALPSVTDYGLFDAMTKVFGGKESIYGVYECLAKDGLYPDPGSLMTFLDNHDVRRILAVTAGDTARTRLALTLLLTTRGIPQLFYGTELAIRGGDDHGTIRADMPGGFPGDSRNAFTREGRTEGENAMFEFIKGLLTVRSHHPALQGGTLIQYPPVDEVYVYFREAPGDTVMVVLNNGTQENELNLRQYDNRLHQAGRLYDLRSGEAVRLDEKRTISVPAHTGVVLGTGARSSGR